MSIERLIVYMLIQSMEDCVVPLDNVRIHRGRNNEVDLFRYTVRLRLVLKFCEADYRRPLTVNESAMHPGFFVSGALAVYVRHQQ